MKTETTPLPAPGPKSHDLTPSERAIMQNVNMAALNAKGRIYDLQAQLEIARTDLAVAEQQFTGALGMLANMRGVPNPKLTQDFTRIEEQ